MNNNYVTVFSWMYNLFPNNRGGVDYIKVLIYAYIYSFSRDGKNTWHGSLNKMAELAATTEQTVCNKLKEIVDDNYIIKREVKRDGFVKFYEYYPNFQLMNDELPINESLTPINESLNGAINESLINNKYNNKTNNKDIEEDPKKETEIESIPLLEEILTLYKSIDYGDRAKSKTQVENFFRDRKKKGWIKSNGEPIDDWESYFTWYITGGNSNSKPKKADKVGISVPPDEERSDLVFI